MNLKKEKSKKNNKKQPIIQELQQQQTLKLNQFQRDKSERKLINTCENNLEIQEFFSFIDHENYQVKVESEQHQYKSFVSIDYEREYDSPKKKVQTHLNQTNELIQFDYISLNPCSLNKEIKSESYFQSSYDEEDCHIYYSGNYQ